MNPQSVEAQNLWNLVQNSNLPTDLKAKANELIQRVDSLIKGNNYAEYESIQNYINWVVKLPFGKFTQDNLDLQNAKAKLDEHHYGLEDVKNKILEYLSVMKLNQQKEGDLQQVQNQDRAKQLRGSSANAPVMLFIGIQGIGKTSLVKSIANSLGRQFVRISLGGMASVNDLRGVSRGFSNSEPGQIVKALINTGVMNPLILLDELDKVSTSGGTNLDVMAALLEILDPEQNASFRDRYIDFPVDLSKCLFIATANNIGGITSALLDRMEIVRFTSYTDEDKKQIAQNYLLPKIRKTTGLGEEQLKFSDDVWDLIIRPLGFDAGIRELERTLTNVSRKVAKQIVEGHASSITVSKDNFREYIPDDFGVYA